MDQKNCSITSVFDKIRIALVDDEPVVHAAIKQTFRNHAPQWTLDCYSSGREAVPQIIQTPPHAVMMDVSMPEMTGIECVKRIKTFLPQLPIVMFTARDDTENFFSSMMAGASGYVVKPSSPVETVSAVQKVLGGASAICSKTEQAIVAWLHGLGGNVSSWKLTPREQQIMLHVCANRTDKEIATLINLSPRTVQHHLQSAFQRLGVHNREAARQKFMMA